MLATNREMIEAVYYYDAYINSRKILYKTHRADLEHGDKIIHTYATGAKSTIIINHGYGTALPAPAVLHIGL